VAADGAARLGVATVTADGVVEWRGSTYAVDTTGHAAGDAVSVVAEAGRLHVHGNATSSGGGTGPGQPTGGGSPIGTIVAWSGTTPPVGWQLCDGAAPGSPALAAIVGATVPDLRGRFLLGSSDVHPKGTAGGAEGVTLTVDQLPSHAHTTQGGGGVDHLHAAGSPAGGHGHTARFRASPEGTGSANSYLRTWGSTDPNTGSTSGAPVGDHTHTSGAADRSLDHNHAISATGGGQSVPTLPPFYCIGWIIKHTGAAADGLTQAEADLLYAPIGSGGSGGSGVPVCEMMGTATVSQAKPAASVWAPLLMQTVDESHPGSFAAGVFTGGPADTLNGYLRFTRNGAGVPGRIKIIASNAEWTLSTSLRLAPGDTISADIYATAMPYAAPDKCAFLHIHRIN
jgi:microcystin-dependent protein